MDEAQPLSDGQQAKSSTEVGPLPPSDDSQIIWEESMLAVSFDNQMKLLDKCIKGVTKTQHQQQQQQQQQSNSIIGELPPNQKHNQSTSKREQKFSHKSQLHRFTGGDNKAEITPSNLAQTRVKELASRVKIMPPPFSTDLARPDSEQEAHASMLMAWYVAGYHAGYYEAIKNFGGDRTKEN